MFVEKTTPLNMGWVTHKIQYCVALSFGIFFAAMSVMGLIWRFIRHPIKSFTTAWPKTRDVMPACLNDPTLGSHGFIHLEASIHFNLTFCTVCLLLCTRMTMSLSDIKYQCQWLTFSTITKRRKKRF